MSDKMQLWQLAKEAEDEMAKLLLMMMAILGIGYYSALLRVSEIGDINRFPDSHHYLCSYAGLKTSASLHD